MVIEKRMKVPNGKLLILKAEIQDGKIVKVHIQGDFFLYPEDKLALLEDALSKSTCGDAEANLIDVVGKENITMVGLTIPALVQLHNEICESL